MDLAQAPRTSLETKQSLLSLSYRGDEPEVALGIVNGFPLDGEDQLCHSVPILKSKYLFQLLSNTVEENTRFI